MTTMLSQRILLVLGLAAASEVAVAGGPFVAVPEPETLALLAIGAAAIAVARWRKKK